ncbi:MAG: hypothetical protein GXP38_10055 [Chloroflexi bacterium]|nr:hypothetical protein [Chloroflexota bacterium]
MKIVKTEYLIRQGPFADSEEWHHVLSDIHTAIGTIEWPKGSGGFFFCEGSTGRSRGEGNGVKPIKDSFCRHLETLGWQRETPVDIATLRRPGPIDVTKYIPDTGLVAVEWETGNISSSHRAVNKMALGLLTGILVAGVLVLPTREMYRYLTDRIGNFAELSPYFPLWKSIPVDNGVLAVIAIEHDGTRPDIPRIPKGTDGRALI